MSDSATEERHHEQVEDRERPERESGPVGGEGTGAEQARDAGPVSGDEDITEHGSDDGDGQAAAALGAGGSDDPVEEIERDRRERLAPENRPANAEVDNTQRTFNTTTGTFEDSEIDSVGPFE